MPARTSSSLNDSFFTLGERWLCQRSRHCLPIRLGSSAAMRDQLEAPYCSTSSISLASSCAFHACLRTDLPPASSLSPSAAPSSSSASSKSRVAALAAGVDTTAATSATGFPLMAQGVT